MRIKSIHLNNIRSYVNETIEFPLGSTLLAGDIGAGKTTVLLALDFALFGIRRGELSGSDLLRHGENSGFVQLGFEVDDKNIIIKRTLKKEKNGSAVQDSGYIEINGVGSFRSPTELRAKVLELIGYPQGFVTKNPILFRYTVYTPQDQMKRIFFDANERLDTIRKIFGIDNYGRIRDNSKTILTELRTMRRVLESKVADIDEKTRELGNAVEIKNSSVLELDENNDLLRTANKEIYNIKLELDRMSKKASEINKLLAELSLNQKEIKMKHERLERVDLDKLGFEKRIAELSTLLNEKMEQPTEMTEADVRNEIRELEKQGKDMISEEGKLSNEIRKLQDIMELGVCSVCEQPVMDRKAFNKKIEEKTILKNRMINDILKNESETRNLSRIYDELISYNNKMQKRMLIESGYEDAVNSRKRLYEEKNRLLLEIKHLDESVNALENKLSQFANFENEKIIAELKLEDANNRKMSVEKGISRIEQQIKNIDDVISSLKREIEEKKADKQKILRLSELVNWIDGSFSPLMSIIERHVLATIQREFNEYFQKWFGLLVPDELLSIKIDEQFTPLIQQNGYDTLYENLSGGEKTAVALAYRLSLNKVINILMGKIKTSDIIILDEPTDGFSADQLDRVRDVLDEIDLKQTIIVSHEQKIDTFVDNVIRFYKENHVTRVEQ